MVFDEERRRILKKSLQVESIEDITGEFKREFFELVNTVIINMIDREDNFFGSFMLKIERDIRIDITGAIVTIPTISAFKMYFNPILFLMFTEEEMGSAFKHEIYHIMYFHYERALSLKKSYSREAITLALDISINQFIKNLPLDYKKIYTVSKELNIELEANRTIEEYAYIIQKAINKRITHSNKDSESDYISREIDISRSHELWDKINMNEEAIEQNVKKIAIGIKNSNPPEDIRTLIKKFNDKEELSWQDILRRMLPSIRAGYKKTITRRDRRQPDRMDLRGKLPSTIPDIIIAIDISASMNNEDLRKIFIEILAISKSRGGKITIIECDNEIRGVYSLRNEKDIRKRTFKSGSTSFTPVFKYIKDNKLKDSILIYFTDGVGEKTIEINPIIKKVIWVITGNEELSLTSPIGEVKRIERSIIVGEGKSSALDMVREVIHEWAR